MSVYRKTYTVTVAGQRVTRRTKTWTIEFRWKGRKRTIAGPPKRGVAEAMEQMLKRVILDRKAGRRINPDDAATISAWDSRAVAKLTEWGVLPPETIDAERPLTAHLDDFERHVRAGGRKSEAFARQWRRMVERTLDETRIRAWSVFSSDRAVGMVDDWLAQQQSAKRFGGATCNQYRMACRHFARFLRKRFGLESAPMESIPLESRPVQSKPMRTVQVDDLRRIIMAARDSAPIQGVAGPDWAMLIGLAALTGLDRRTISSLTPENIEPGADGATVIRARRSKTGEPVTVAVHVAQVAAWLAERAQQAGPGQPMIQMPARTADAMRAFCKAAGVPYRDGAGRVFNWRALRKQASNQAFRGGADPRLVQQMLGHADIRTTMAHYNEAMIEDAHRAARSMPELPFG